MENHVADWLRVHRQLIDAETAFTDLAIKATDGSISSQQLEEARSQLMALRELCSVIYIKAFPSGGK
ncbi:hypothetical protein FN976_17185 [Caenimonas sedimenti]|uniref:Uncharacterized protein n=1 Tax=Caenimonas sedimenti TaxID=2596921 RepID=A0A562ZNB5_9BURK|nr:hypothetical protein [Caenimonas sedimenti]TWO70070.1 hypothetical protein FN976_17185 [Caenimonas sedimenti]